MLFPNFERVYNLHDKISLDECMIPWRVCFPHHQSLGLGRFNNNRFFIKITTHLNLQDMFRSCNDHLQLKVELI